MIIAKFQQFRLELIIPTHNWRRLLTIAAGTSPLGVLVAPRRQADDFVVKCYFFVLFDRQWLYFNFLCPWFGSCRICLKPLCSWIFLTFFSALGAIVRCWAASTVRLLSCVQSWKIICTYIFVFLQNRFIFDFGINCRFEVQLRSFWVFCCSYIQTFKTNNRLSFLIINRFLRNFFTAHNRFIPRVLKHNQILIQSFLSIKSFYHIVRYHHFTIYFGLL